MGGMSDPKIDAKVLSKRPDFLDADDYYSHTFHCKNCQHENDRWIPKGMLIAVVPVTCDRCGCDL